MKKLLLLLILIPITLCLHAQTHGQSLASILERLPISSYGKKEKFYNRVTVELLDSVLDSRRERISQYTYTNGDTLFVILDGSDLKIINDDYIIDIRITYVPPGGKFLRGMKREEFLHQLAITESCVDETDMSTYAKAIKEWDPAFLKWMFLEIDSKVVYDRLPEPRCVYRCIIDHDEMRYDYIPFFSSVGLTEEEYADYKERYLHEVISEEKK